ncbi:alpha/beta hydrolase [Pseudosporangium ferrugineum]|uniref:Alpha/beta hydrolase family protein n=1 Tax=Pseudosporangium ferrugineum TaxID=439699 RepID=A0A2T0RDN4_9ACTN|nr:alpha/beta hydrolase [Pseudosporangium ferrugineum]PRY19272.1 alpha/beta hydrolase family protein [Pseudosporangium ferrugineum]
MNEVRKRPKALAAIAALVTVAALALAPTAGAATAAPRPAAGDPAALPERFTKQSLDWQECYEDDFYKGLQCATIDAPIDYLSPDNGSLTVRISRIVTSTPDKHRGVLLFNPGGPGAPGLTEPLFKRDDLPESVRRQYDLIGFDPRGIGDSSPISCGLEGDEAVQYFPYREDKYEHYVAAAQAVADKCAAAGPTAGHISTRNTARDMDLIRILLGEKKISYFGVSYGTYLGAVYTQLFPDRTDRMVLDSNLDPGRMGNDIFLAMTEAFSDVFARFTQSVAEHDDTYHLGATPEAVEKTVFDLVAEIDRHPIDIDGRKFAGQEARSGIASASYDVEEGVQYLRTLRDALDGKPQDLVIPEYGGGDDQGTSVFWSVLCNDSADWPRGAEGFREQVAEAMRRYPLIGDFLTSVKPCGFWSLPRPEPDLVVANDVPALLLQNEYDPATPATLAHGLHKALRESRLVTVEKALNHGVYGDANPCVVEVVHAYLATGELPAQDITCQQEDRPEERQPTKLSEPARL